MAEQKITRVKRPKDFKIDDKYSLSVGEPGQKICYLNFQELDCMTNHYWIKDTRKLKALKKWVDGMLKYAEVKK